VTRRYLPTLPVADSLLARHGSTLVCGTASLNSSSFTAAHLLPLLTLVFHLSTSPPIHPPIHPSIHLPSYGSTALCGPWPPFQFLNLYTVGRTPWTGDQPVARPLPTHRTTQQRINAHRHPCLECDSNPRSPVFEWTRTVHASDSAATVIGLVFYS
jgi:hypothetical protein